jgi:hypothetical protein
MRYVRYKTKAIYRRDLGAVVLSGNNPIGACS